MKFIRYPQYCPLPSRSVVTIGNFDGLHIGHQALIKQVAALAKEKNLSSVVVSMQPLASQYFAGKDNIAVLTPFKYKYHLIKQMGIDVMCVLNFNEKLAQLSPLDFIDSILIKGLKGKHIVVGDDFKFGKNRAGDYQMLKDYCQSLAVSVSDIKSIVNNNLRVSSSQIRKDLKNGEFAKVKDALGRDFSIIGKISQGQQLGRRLGFPTINLRLYNNVVPIHGVFAVRVKFQDDSEYVGAASLGTRPTVNGKINILEVHILDFNKQVYGQNVEVLFYHKIRNEVKFDSLSELKRHIKDDVLKTRLYFNQQ